MEVMYNSYHEEEYADDDKDDSVPMVDQEPLDTLQALVREEQVPQGGQRSRRIHL